MTNSTHDIPTLIQTLRQGNKHVVNMAKNLAFPWDPEQRDMRYLHNMYARNLVTCYVSKFSNLTEGLLNAVEQDNYLVYALCGRSLLETTAVLRYYITRKYKPLLDKGSLTAVEIQELIDIDDRHLRGTRFNWEAYLFQNYARLKSDVVAHLRSKKKGKAHAEAAKLIIAPQVNVLTCVEHWAHETPEVLIAYNLFCDLVHPNLGSTFLVASVSGGQLYFSRHRGEPVGRQILEQSLPLLASTTHREFGPLLGMLMGTIWSENEL